MARDRLAKAIISSLEKELGLRAEFRQNRHLVFNCQLNGQRFNWSLSSTPSDVHADNQALRDLRRELRKCGVDEPPRLAVRGLRKLTLSNDAWDALRAWEEQLTAIDSKP